jgi:hypothetical protein
MRYIFPLFIFLSCLLTFLPGCEPKEDLVQTSGSLEFDQDTVKFDTVFTTIKTVTKRLWVYNRNGGAVKTDVSLASKAGTTYSLVINGDAGASASSITIRGKDSLLVLVRAVLGDNGTSAKPKDFIVEDQLNFRTNGNEQNVKLWAYGQNAYFHRATIITGDVTWPTDKPHVIINSPSAQAGGALLGVYVTNTGILRIPKGARIYCHAGAYLQVNGTLRVNDDFTAPIGTANDTVKATNPNIVRFQGDRLEPFYNDIPGQWGGIIFTSSSHNNSIRYAEIKNATFGALLYNPDDSTPRPDLTLSNSVIRNISGSNLSFANATASTGGGVLSYSGRLTATNCLFTNCGEYAVLGVGGGNYDFNFCTIANYTPAFHRETSSLTFTNEFETSTGIVKRDTDIRIRNSIVWGSYEDELFLQNNGDPNFTFSVVNSLLRTKEYQAATATTGKPGLAASGLFNLVNVDPLFVRTALISNNPDYRLQATSPAIVPLRNFVGALPSPNRDLLNLPRSSITPTIGAYERR